MRRRQNTERWSGTKTNRGDIFRQKDNGGPKMRAIKDLLTGLLQQVKKVFQECERLNKTGHSSKQD